MPRARFTAIPGATRSSRCRHSPSGATPPRRRAPRASARSSAPTATRTISPRCCARASTNVPRRSFISPARIVPLLTAVAYRAVKVERFAPDVAAALAQGALDGVLHFSRRSAQAYLDCATRARILEGALAPVQFCLSRQVSQPLAAAGAAAIRLAAQPNETAMIDLVGP